MPDPAMMTSYILRSSMDFIDWCSPNFDGIPRRRNDIRQLGWKNLCALPGDRTRIHVNLKHMHINRWFVIFTLWNVSAGALFVSIHDFMEHPMLDLPLVLMLASLVAYPLLHKAVMRHRPRSTGALAHWFRGFHFLFWAEALMEAVAFTLLDFHDTPQNDPYFVGFWICVAVWFVGGWPWLASKWNRESTPS